MDFANSAYASINRGPAHANFKRVLAAFPLCVAGRHSDLVEQSEVLQQALDSG